MRILIADDESLIRMGLRSMLEAMGHQVIDAVNGREAIRMAESQLPDLAILDIRMPYTDGLQAADTISRQRPIPILILTAYSEADLVDRATDLPIHGYLVKPIRPEDLEPALLVARKRFADSQELAGRAGKLEQDMETRKLVERAKGRLMTAGLDEEDAYRLIQKQARSRNQSMGEAAELILQRLSKD